MNKGRREGETEEWRKERKEGGREKRLTMGKVIRGRMAHHVILTKSVEMSRQWSSPYLSVRGPLGTVLVDMRT